jgi:hypothetical protein
MENNRTKGKEWTNLLGANIRRFLNLLLVAFLCCARGVSFRHGGNSMDDDFGLPFNSVKNTTITVCKKTCEI